MATRALDVITIMHALEVLSKEIGAQTWGAMNVKQQKLFEWYYQLKHNLDQISGLQAKASRFYNELNEFLVSNGFDPMVDPFDPNLGVGVVSILDKLVNWLNGPGELVTINTNAGTKPGFELPPSGVEVFEVLGMEGLLIKLLTKSSDNLWIYTNPDKNIFGLDMVSMALDVMSRPRTAPISKGLYGPDYPTYGPVQVPMIDFNIKPDLEWLLGAATQGTAGSYAIEQAKQQFKMRMDETGARVKVATVIVAKRSVVEEPKILTLDQPFYGWWSQKHLENIPMAVFFADYDVWKKPAGSLNDM